MFKELMKSWSEQAFSSRIVDEFLTMLDSSEEMLAYSFKILNKNSKGKKSQLKIYGKDRSINLKEKDIRKQLLIHLTTNHRSNLSASLALLIMAKDAERLGDYVKNIFELNQLMQDIEMHPEVFNRLYLEIGDELLELFKEVSTAFRNSDRSAANNAIAHGRNISNACGQVIEDIVQTDYTAREAVALALGARYMKRIALHLANIASSVVNPFTELDFFTESEQGQ